MSKPQTLRLRLTLLLLVGCAAPVSQELPATSLDRFNAVWRGRNYH